MKLNFIKRVVLFFHWLLSLLVVLCVFFSEYASMAYEKIQSVIDPKYMKIGSVAVMVIYAILSICVLIMVFKRSSKRTERGFITMDSSETGKVRIAVGAVEQMVKQAVGTVDGIADMRISISSLDDAIAINVNVSVVNGSHVPTVTMNMQRAIRQFVELNCGVAVRSVAINVQTVVNPSEGSKRGRKAEKAMPAAQPAAVPQSEPVAEEPVMAYTPVEEYSAAADFAQIEMPAAEESVSEQPEVIEEVYAEEPEMVFEQEPTEVFETIPAEEQVFEETLEEAVCTEEPASEDDEEKN